MLAVAALTVAINAAVATHRPMLSRIAGTCPVGITIVVSFTHAQLGRNATLAVLRGWISFLSRFLATGRSLEALAIPPAIGCVRGGVNGPSCALASVRR